MYSQANTQALIRTLTVSTAARLHMGFFDLSGKNKFGSLGLAIDSPCTKIIVEKSEKTLINGKTSQNVADITENIVNVFNLKQPFSLTIKQTIPNHAGLGSGTQLALAIGTGLNELFDLQLSTLQIAAAAMRGKRSGIGIAAFQQGGFLVDAGKLSDAMPEIAMRHAFPEDWRVILVQDNAHVGVHGALESQAFKSLNPAQGSMCAMVFEHMLPAMQRADLLAFGAYMQDLQAYNGAYFAPIQGGHYASQDVERVLNWLRQNGVACVGQSSWWPTGFAIVETAKQAEAFKNKAQLEFKDKSNISFQIVRGKNTGASISVLER